jgi:hypothetical protein
VHRDASWWLGFSGKKPFYHGSRPLPLSNPGKLLIFRRLGYGPFRFWGNSCKVEVTLIDAYLANPNSETIVSSLLAILEKAASNNETR